MDPNNPMPQTVDPNNQPPGPQPAPPVQPLAPQPPSSGSKSKKMLIGLLAGLFLVGGGAAAYVQFVHNSPQKIWERTMSSTAKGLDKLVELSQQDQAPGYKIDGRFSVTSPLAIDGSMDGQWKDGNGAATFDIGATGFRVNGEMRTLQNENSSNPDSYFKVSGLEAVSSLLGFFGTSPLNDDSAETDIVSEIDDQWFGIDHTLLDQLLASAEGADGPMITDDDMDAIVAALTGVMKDTLFTAGDRAVFTVLEEFGSEDFEGTDSYKYRVGIDKENLKSMLSDLKEALRETKFMELLTIDDSMTYDDFFGLDSLFEDIDGADFSKATADVWAEKNGKFIRNIRIYPIEDEKDTNYLDIGIPYKEGDVIPFLVRATMNDQGSEGTLSFGFDVNQTNADTRIWFDVDIRSDFLGFVADGELSINSSSDDVSVEAPEDSRNILEMLDLFGGVSDLLLPADPTTTVPISDTFPLDDFEL